MVLPQRRKIDNFIFIIFATSDVQNFSVYINTFCHKLLELHPIHRRQIQFAWFWKIKYDLQQKIFVIMILKQQKGLFCKCILFVWWINALQYIYDICSCQLGKLIMYEIKHTYFYFLYVVHNYSTLLVDMARNNLLYLAQ
jgi:hypothetical protein